MQAAMDIGSWHKTEVDGIRIHRAAGLERAEFAVHGFSGRWGGVSRAPYDTLNLSLNVGDDPEAVLENRRRFAAAMGLDAANLVSADQPHGNEVAIVTAADVGKGALEFGTALKGVDALVTNESGPVLALHYADCVPVFLVDPVNRAVGLVHAGWKGTLIDVTGAAVRKMTETYGSRPEEMLAAIGPAIGRCCFEVDAPLADRFLAVTGGDPRVICQSKAGKLQADVKLTNWLQLRRAGLAEESIFLSQACTSCSADEFFSYRRENRTGRMSAWITIR